MVTLAAITVRKCHRQIARFKTATRDIDREAVTPLVAEQQLDAHVAVARDPTPLEAIALTELVQQLMRGLNERERLIVTTRLQGYSVAEISSEVGRTEPQVERVLEQVPEAHCKPRGPRKRGTKLGLIALRE